MNSLRGCINNIQLTQHFIQRLQSAKLHRSSAVTNNVSSASKNEPEIIIPHKIERRPTDILLALESTISRDPTAAHYKFHDDPLLIPTSNMAKRTFALSKEAGRKAAMWIRSEYSLLFNDKLADPEIKLFLPKAVYESEEDVSEELLKSVIKEGSVNDAITIYKLLKGNISVESKQALLELLCFYNSQEQLPEELIEERWYRKSAERQKQMWRDSPVVEELFSSLKDVEGAVSAAAYNTMICASAKYWKVQRAEALFQECEEKNIPMTIQTYNSIIVLVPTFKDGDSARQALLLELLRKINNAGLKPNVKTLNAALRVASVISAHGDLIVAKDLVGSLFTEFSKIGVKPCLTSYYFVLTIFCKDFGPRSTILVDILKELKGKSLTIQDSWDTFFFVTAMGVAHDHLNDYETADKLHKLLLTGDNYRLIGEGFKESIYYRHYMSVLLDNLSFSDFMKMYDLMVPNIYIPEPSVVENILKIMEMVEPSKVQQVLSRFWSHIVMFEQLDRESIVSAALNLMRNRCAPPEDSPLNNEFAEAAWTYWKHINEKMSQRFGNVSISGTLMGQIAVLSLRGKYYDRFLEVLDKLLVNRNSIVGAVNAEDLKMMFDTYMESGDAFILLLILEYSIEAGFDEAVTMAAMIKSNVSLTPDQEKRLSAMVGPELLDMLSPIEQKAEDPTKKL